MLTTGGRDIDWILRRMAVGSVQLAQRRPAILNMPGIFGEREEFFVTNNYRALTASQKNQIVTFLNSLSVRLAQGRTFSVFALFLCSG
jgi:hypothetical protein